MPTTTRNTSAMFQYRPGGDYVGTSIDFNRFEGITFLHFPNVQVPKNATINSAVVTGLCTGVGTDSDSGDVLYGVWNTRFYAEAADNIASIVTTKASAIARTRTTAYNLASVWTRTTGQTGTFTTTTAIQEVINRSGWVSGNGLHLIFTVLDYDTYSASNNYAGPMTLTIDYTATASAASSKLLAVGQPL